MQRVKNESNQLQWNTSKTPEESVLVSLFSGVSIHLGRERRGGVLSSGVSLYQANEKSSGFQKGAYRDGVKREETSQGWDWKHTL